MLLFRYHVKSLTIWVKLKASQPINYHLLEIQPLILNAYHYHMHMKNSIIIQIQPSQHTICDFHTCTNEKLTSVVRLGCFHTCHETCLKENKNECQLCKVPLSMKIKELSESFNESLLNPECAGQPSINNDASEDEDEPD